MDQMNTVMLPMIGRAQYRPLFLFVCLFFVCLFDAADEFSDYVLGDDHLSLWKPDAGFARVLGERVRVGVDTRVVEQRLVIGEAPKSSLVGVPQSHQISSQSGQLALGSSLEEYLGPRRTPEVVNLTHADSDQALLILARCFQVLQ